MNYNSLYLLIFFCLIVIVLKVSHNFFLTAGYIKMNDIKTNLTIGNLFLYNICHNDLLIILNCWFETNFELITNFIISS